MLVPFLVAVLFGFPLAFILALMFIIGLNLFHEPEVEPCDVICGEIK